MDRRWSWVFAGVVALGVLAFVGLPLATGLTASLERRDDPAAVVDGGRQRSDRDGAPGSAPDAATPGATSTPSTRVSSGASCFASSGAGPPDVARASASDSAIA